MNKKKTKISKNKRIIKLNKLKITLIILIVSTLMIGLGVGIYFAVSSTKFKMNGDIENVSISKARENVLKNKGNSANKGTGVFFYSSDSSDVNTQFLLFNRDASDSKNKPDANGGPFSNYTKENTDYMKWYGVDTTTKDNKDTMQFALDFFSDGNGNESDFGLENQITIIDALNKDFISSFDPESPEKEGTIEVIPIYGDDKHNYKVVFLDSNAGQSDVTIGANQFLWFDAQSNLKYIVTGISTDSSTMYENPDDMKDAFQGLQDTLNLG